MLPAKDPWLQRGGGDRDEGGGMAGGRGKKRPFDVGNALEEGAEGGDSSRYDSDIKFTLSSISGPS